MGGLGSGRRIKRLGDYEVNQILAESYSLVIRSFRDPEVSKDKKLEVAAAMVKRIIPEKISMLVQESLSLADRSALIESMRSALLAMPAKSFIDVAPVPEKIDIGSGAVENVSPGPGSGCPGSGAAPGSAPAPAPDAFVMPDAC